MARVAGIEIPNNKRSEIALTYIFGIGRTSAQEILKKAGVNFDVKVKDIPEQDLDTIRKIVDSEYMIEGTLRATIRMNIKRLMDIGSYRGLRHRKGLPVRGQRSKTNARSRKGPRKTIAGKKNVTKK